MWELDHKESWAPNNYAFELWRWRRLLRVSGTARRSNQSILKEISPGCSLEGLILELKIETFGHLMWRADSLERPWCWEKLRAGGEGDDGEWDGWMASRTQWTWVWVGSGSWWWTGRPGLLRFMGSQRVGLDGVTELNRCSYVSLPQGLRTYSKIGGRRNPRNEAYDWKTLDQCLSSSTLLTHCGCGYLSRHHRRFNGIIGLW